MNADFTTLGRFVAFTTSCLWHIRKGNAWEAGKTWSMAVGFASDLAKSNGSFDRAWIILKALEGAAREKGVL
jgi:hypothetical protein